MKRCLPPALMPESHKRARHRGPKQVLDLPSKVDPKSAKISVIEHWAKRLTLPQLRQGDAGHGLVFGLVSRRQTGEATLSAATVQRPNFLELLTTFAATKFPQFQYTSIQIARNNTGLGLHVDRTDCGFNMAMTFGDFQGGQIWEMHQGVMDCFHRPQRVDSSYPHMVLPFSGER